MKKDFSTLTFDDFRELAVDPSLNRHEKVGFPTEYREGKEIEIFHDIIQKLPSLSRTKSTVMEIGPGCSELPLMLVRHCQLKNSDVIFVDNEEMLAQLPDEPCVSKYAGPFPEAIRTHANRLAGSIDTIIAYSVIQYVFAGGNLWEFLDHTLSLLRDGGEILLGDIPNISMRKRFLASDSGKLFHQRFSGEVAPPRVEFNRIEAKHIDDSVVLSLVARARGQGFHAWIIPQELSLPMGNRREDLLIRKP